MEKFVPFEKLSKKERQKRNAKKRGSWYGLNPVTRKPENPKAYNRQKARKWRDDSMTVPFAYLGYPGKTGRYAVWRERIASTAPEVTPLMLTSLFIRVNIAEEENSCRKEAVFRKEIMVE